MAKFDRQKTKHQLFHVSISLATTLVCMQCNWRNLGNFWKSLIIPIIFIGELLKVILARYYSVLDDASNNATTNVPSRSTSRKPPSHVSLRELCSGLLLQFLCMLIYAFICVILGAPVLHSFEQTFVLSVMLTIMTVSPTVFLMGGGGALQVCFCENPECSKSERTALDLFKNHAFGAVLGAFIGSIVEPLDWDRDWQVYPIPNVLGALLGSALGNIYACTRVLYATAKVYLNKKRL